MLNVQVRAPGGGIHIATVGPFPVHAGRTYNAGFFGALFTPGMKGAGDTHRVLFTNPTWACRR
jgi:hypothetical protein